MQLIKKKQRDNVEIIRNTNEKLLNMTKSMEIIGRPEWPINQDPLGENNPISIIELKRSIEKTPSVSSFNSNDNLEQLKDKIRRKEERRTAKINKLKSKTLLIKANEKINKFSRDQTKKYKEKLEESISVKKK